MADSLTPESIVNTARRTGISMKEVCRRAGIAQSTFSRWKAGQTEPSLGVYRRLRDAAVGKWAPGVSAAEPARPVARCTRDPVIDQAIALAGGMRAFAEMCATRPPEVRSWRSVPKHLVLAIEAETGIHRSRLRPDIYPPDGQSDPAMATEHAA